VLHEYINSISYIFMYFKNISHLLLKHWILQYDPTIIQSQKKNCTWFSNLSPRFLSSIWRVIYLQNVRISRAKQLWKYWPVIKVSHMVYWITSTINQRTVFSWTLNFISDVSRVTTMFAWRQNDKHYQNAQGLRTGFAVRSTRRQTLLLLITAWAIVH